MPEKETIDFKRNVKESLKTLAEIEIGKTYFKAGKQINNFQISYFIYDRSSLLKQTFISKIEKFLNIYCSVSFFGEATKETIPLISSKNTKSFFTEKNKIKEEINLQIAKVSGKKAATIDEKILDVSISRIVNKRKEIVKKKWKWWTF